MKMDDGRFLNRVTLQVATAMLRTVCLIDLCSLTADAHIRIQAQFLERKNFQY